MERDFNEERDERKSNLSFSETRRSREVREVNNGRVSPKPSVGEGRLLCHLVFSPRVMILSSRR